ncbi:MAG TPA: hypothetical protein VME70_16060 [Mycobacteriales bacterium]|nr:hypothetical protein [Mycobacteriales bacterium]
MTVDERDLSAALHALDPDLSPDLVTKVRAGGRRRLLRRRSYVAAGVVAVGAAATPVGLALRAGGAPDQSVGVAGHHRARAASDLYASPPPVGSQCNSGYSATHNRAGHALASTYPQLLLLPPNQPIDYAFVRSQRPSCPSPHVALTAVRAGADTDHQGLVVEGPNAPTAVEDGRAGPTIGFTGQTGHEPILGEPGSEFTITSNGHTDAFWTEPDGGQWYAEVRHLPQDQAVALLDHLALDPAAGTATLNGAGSGWSTEPAAADVRPDQTGIVFSQWTDPDGHEASMTVTETPNRIDQLAAGSYVDFTFVTVRGQRAILAPDGGQGGGVQSLTWQEAADVQVSLTIDNASAAEIEQVADSLQLASPSDPRISKH